MFLIFNRDREFLPFIIFRFNCNHTFWIWQNFNSILILLVASIIFLHLTYIIRWMWNMSHIYDISPQFHIEYSVVIRVFVAKKNITNYFEIYGSDIKNKKRDLWKISKLVKSYKLLKYDCNLLKNKRHIYSVAKDFVLVLHIW